MFETQRGLRGAQVPDPSAPLTASYSLDELAGPVLCEFTETSK